MTKLTREDIVIGAGKRFATHGYHGTSMRDLGDDLGILGSSIYAHIGGKHELLVAVVERAAELFAEVASRAERAGVAPSDTLLVLIKGHIGVLVDHAAEANTFLNEAPFLEPEERARIIGARDAYEAFYRATVAKGIDDGSFRAELDPVLAGIYILSTLNAIGRWYDPAGRVPRDELATDMHRFFIQGMT